MDGGNVLNKYGCYTHNVDNNANKNDNNDIGNNTVIYFNIKKDKSHNIDGNICDIHIGNSNGNDYKNNIR